MSFINKKQRIQNKLILEEKHFHESIYYFTASFADSLAEFDAISSSTSSKVMIRSLYLNFSKEI